MSRYVASSLQTSIPTNTQCRNYNLLEQVGTSPDQVPLLIQRITGCPLRT